MKLFKMKKNLLNADEYYYKKYIIEAKLHVITEIHITMLIYIRQKIKIWRILINSLQLIKFYIKQKIYNIKVKNAFYFLLKFKLFIFLLFNLNAYIF